MAKVRCWLRELNEYEKECVSRCDYLFGRAISSLEEFRAIESKVQEPISQWTSRVEFFNAHPNLVKYKYDRTKTYKPRAWSKTEDEYLYNHYSKQQIEVTASHLKRSIYSVKQRARRLNINCYMDTIGARAIARCFNSDISVVIRWIAKLNLPATKIPYGNTFRYHIDTCKFWEWAYEHKDKINWSKYQRYSLPPEPDWVYEMIKNSHALNSHKDITDEEILTIQWMAKTGHNNEEIAKQLNRSICSIKHIKEYILI